MVKLYEIFLPEKNKKENQSKEEKSHLLTTHLFPRAKYFL